MSTCYRNPNCDDSPSKDVLLRSGWAEHPLAEEQLYDLVFDPNEAFNIAGEPTARAVLEEMRDRLERWMQQTNDPLLRGPVPAPPGAQLNEQNQLSAREPTHVV